MNFTPQNIVMYVPFHFKNNVVLKKMMSFTLILPKFQLILTLYHLFYTRLRLMHLNRLPKQHNKATESELKKTKKNAYVHKNILHG